MEARLWTAATQLDEHVALLVADGEITVETSPQLEKGLNELLAAHTRTTAVIVDMSLTSLLDLPGVSLLVKALRLLRARDGRLVLVISNPAVLQTLESAGIAPSFTLVSTRADALDLLGVDPAGAALAATL